MVRTSDFHSENVSSNLASPIIIHNKKNKIDFFNKTYFFKNLLLQKNKKIQIKYTANFISLVSPLSFKKTNFNDNHRKNLSKLNNKSFFKRSYTALTWFYYLTFVNLKKNQKTNIHIFVKPKTRKCFTNTKAPMAHKNNSKEQYKFEFYSFVITFKTDSNNPFYFNNKSIYQNFILLWITKKNLFFLETNSLFLKSYIFYSSFSDTNFFKLK